MGKERRTYAEEPKRSALNRLRQSGKTGADVARELGIGVGELGSWRHVAEQEEKGEGEVFPGNGIPRDEELA
ncbi:MAG TPA: transposase [Mesotoga sp.]|nr:transposase [Mesotoga sp.]